MLNNDSDIDAHGSYWDVCPDLAFLDCLGVWLPHGDLSCVMLHDARIASNFNDDQYMLEPWCS